MQYHTGPVNKGLSLDRELPLGKSICSLLTFLKVFLLTLELPNFQGWWNPFNTYKEEAKFNEPKYKSKKIQFVRTDDCPKQKKEENNEDKIAIIKIADLINLEKNIFEG